MNYLRYLPVICIVGAVVGFISFTQLWVHTVDGYAWSLNLTGMQLMDSGWEGFQAYVPVIMVVFSVAVIVLSILAMTSPRFWFAPFVSLLMGILIMALNSLFSMWVPFDDKIIHFVDIGFWLAYACGAIIVIGCAIQYSSMFRKPVNRVR